jgi:uncharacterized RDD family membrane protein YckC
MKVTQPLQEPIDTSAEVETPEHVRFHHHLAGPARRALAYLIDLLVRGVIMLFLGIVASIAGVTMGDGMRGFSMGLLLLVYFVIEWGYYVFFEMVWGGRSPGKRALNLRVVTDTGRPLHFLDSVLRNLLRAADGLPPLIGLGILVLGSYALGIVTMGRDRRFRRLGDMVAGTMVVVEARHEVETALYINPVPTPRELSSLPQRVPLSGDELEALELYLRRVPRLHPARAEELAEIVAPVFARRLNVRFRGENRRFLEVLYYRSRERTAA